MINTMECPRYHGKLEHISVAYSSEQVIGLKQCLRCGGVFMNQQAQHSLFISDYALMPASIKPLFNMKCPSCGSLFRISDSGRVHLRSCEKCGGIWVDMGALPILLAQHTSFPSFGIQNGELDRISVHCIDCNRAMHTFEELHSTILGFCCDDCFRRAQGLSGQKVQNLQMLRYRGMEVKIDHRIQTTHSRISVTPVEPTPLDITLRSLSWPERLIRLGYRRFRFEGPITRYFETDAPIDPIFRLFLAQKGVIELLYRMRLLGRTELSFKPHNLRFEIEPDYASTAIRLRFEIVVRRFLNAYLNFEKRCLDR